MIYNELKPKHKSSPIEVCCWVYHIYSICSLSSKNNVGHLRPKKIASKKNTRIKKKYYSSGKEGRKEGSWKKPRLYGRKLEGTKAGRKEGKKEGG
jgi:hypothetical protein